MLVPVGPPEDVEKLVVAYGAEDAIEERIPPEATDDDAYPELKGPTVE